MIRDIDLDFHYTYQKYASGMLRLSINSIGADLIKIKTVCLDARDRGMRINPQVSSRKFNVPKEKSDFVTISEEELNQIMKFKGTESLMNARDWLVIGCWTGCRVNDLMKLSDVNIFKNVKGRQFIRYNQEKTGKQVDIPLHPHVKKIIESRNGKFPRKISDQRFNQYIKEVCRKSNMTGTIQGSRQNPVTHKKEVGIFEKWQLIRSHTSRRSFATNHYDKLPNKVIMSVTGHSTEKMLLEYIGETDNSHLDQFYNLWD